MTSSQPISMLRPRTSIHSAEPALTTRARIVTVVIFASMLMALIAANADFDVRNEWLLLVPFILASIASLAVSVRLDGGLYTGFAPVSAFCFALMIGFERSVLVMILSYLLVIPLASLLLNVAGQPRGVRRTVIFETAYAQGTAGLSILAAGWVYNSLSAAPRTIMETAFLAAIGLYFGLTVLRSAVWLWLRGMAIRSFARKFWHILLINHFLALALAPIVAPLLLENPLSSVGLLLFIFGMLLLTVLDNGYLEANRRLAHLETLNSIGRALAANLELDELLRTIRKEIGQLVDVAGFYLALYDADAATITFPVDYEDNILQPPSRIAFGAGSLTEHVIRTRKPLLIKRDVAGFLRRFDIRPVSPVGLSYLGVPILSGDRVIGVIALRSFERESAYTRDDMALLQSIAAQAGVALRNAQLYDQSRRQAVELSSINRVASLLAASTDLKRLIKSVCEMVVNVMGYDKAAVWLKETDEKEPRLINSIGMSADFQAVSSRLRIDQTRAEVFRNGKPVVIQDILALNDLEVTAELGSILNFRSVLEVPLKIGSNIIGSVAAYYDQPRPISPSEVEVLETLGGLIAVAVESARLFEAIRARSHQLATLYEASESLNASLSLKNVLRALSVTLIQSLHTASVSTWLADDSGLELQAALRMIQVDGGGNEEPFPPVEIELDDLPQVQVAVTHRQPALLSRDDPELTEGARRLMDYCHLAVGLLLPLVMHGDMVGLLAVSPPEGQPGFQSEQQQLAEALANQAAVAIDNARRFERTDIALANRLDELSALERVSRRMTSQLDVQSVIKEVVEAAASATGCEYVDVALLDQESGLVRSIHRRSSISEINVPSQWPADAGLTGQALRSRQTVRVGDVSQNPDYIGARRDVKAELVAPIIVRDQIIGVLNLESTRLHAFTSEHERFVTNLAEYAALSLANARLYESERRQREIAEILLETGAAVNSSPSLGEVLATLSQQLLMISGFHGCSIFTLDDSGETLSRVTYHSRCVWPRGTGQPYALDDYPLSARVVKSGTSVALYQGMPDPDRAEMAFMERNGLAALIMLPLRAGKKIIGLVEIVSATPELAADQKILRQYEIILKDAARWITAPLESNSTERLFELAQQLASQAPYTDCWVSEVNRKTKQIESFLQYGGVFWPNRRGPGLKVANNPLIENVLKNGVSLFSREGDLDFAANQIMQAKWGMRGLVTQPLARMGRPIGIIQLFNVAEDRSPDDEELRLWRLVGDQAAVAIENADLFEAIQRRGEEFSTLRSLAVELLASTDLTHSLQTICRHAMERTDAHEVFIYLYDQDQDQLTFGASLWRTGEVNKETMPPRPSGITATVARTGEVQVINDLQDHPVFADVAHLPHWQKMTSVVGMPLRVSGRTIGVFTSVFSDRSSLGDDTLHFLGLLAAQAAVAIENTRLAEETRTGRDRLEAVLNSSHDGLMIFNQDNQLVLANPRTEYLLNIHINELIASQFVAIMQRIGETLDDAERDGWLQDALRLAESIGENPLSTTRRRYSLGVSTPHAIEETSTAVTAINGEILGRLFVLHDVTDQVELEAYRQELSSMIVHDLRSPLGSLITGLDMALHEADTMPENAQAEPLKMTLSVGLDSAKSLLKLVEAILDVNKLETGEMPLTLRPMNLRKTARMAIERLLPASAAAEITVELKASNRLRNIVADQDMIERVIVNLLDNALRHTPKGGKIVIDIQAKPTHQTLSVTDSGEGIAAEFRERVFERFFQLNAQKRGRGSKGTGLGLTFCRLAVEAHRGRIWVDDGPEGGASFHFILPTDLGPSAAATA